MQAPPSDDDDASLSFPTGYKVLSTAKISTKSSKPSKKAKITVPAPVKPAGKPKPATNVPKIKLSRSQLDPADQSELELLEVVPSGSDSEAESKTAPASKAKKRRPVLQAPPASHQARKTLKLQSLTPNHDPRGSCQAEAPSKGSVRKFRPETQPHRRDFQPNPPATLLPKPPRRLPTTPLPSPSATSSMSTSPASTVIASSCQHPSLSTTF